MFSDEFLKRIPKTDLHLHLDGSLRLTTLIELAKKFNVELPAYTPEGLMEKVFKERYKDLPEYLQCFAYTGAVMRTVEALERISYELAVDNFEEGVRYFEVRFAPQLHVDVYCSDEAGVKDIPSVIAAVNRGLKTACEEWNAKPEIVNGEEPKYDYGIIVCAMRFFNEYFSSYFKNLCAIHQHEPLSRVYGLAAYALVAASVEAIEKQKIPIVALDIAGAERGYPADWFVDAYAYAHKNFLKKTVHAGEAYGPESIFQAITDLYAERIGHGFHIFSWELVQKNEKIKTDEYAKQYVNELVQYVADRRITLEICLTSNLQTMPELKNDVRNHSFRKMIDNQMSVSLCTDNRLVSRTNVCQEYRLAIDSFDLNPKQLKEIVVAGFKRSFYPADYTVKRAYVRSVLDYYDKLVAEFIPAQLLRAYSADYK